MTFSDLSEEEMIVLTSLFNKPFYDQFTTIRVGNLRPVVGRTLSALVAKGFLVAGDTIPPNGVNTRGQKLKIAWEYHALAREVFGYAATCRALGAWPKWSRVWSRGIEKGVDDTKL
jgi:hypothetical protein